MKFIILTEITVKNDALTYEAQEDLAAMILDNLAHNGTRKLPWVIETDYILQKIER